MRAVLAASLAVLIFASAACGGGGSQYDDAIYRHHHFAHHHGRSSALGGRATAADLRTAGQHRHRHGRTDRNRRHPYADAARFAHPLGYNVLHRRDSDTIAAARSAAGDCHTRCHALDRVDQLHRAGQPIRAEGRPQGQSTARTASRSRNASSTRRTPSPAAAPKRSRPRCDVPPPSPPPAATR